jgi:hypothetical protein
VSDILECLGRILATNINQDLLTAAALPSAKHLNGPCMATSNGREVRKWHSVNQ